MKPNEQRNDKQPADESDPDQQAKIEMEEVKDRHTTHWDRDYLSTEALEAEYQKGKDESKSGDDQA